MSAHLHAVIRCHEPFIYGLPSICKLHLIWKKRILLRDMDGIASILFKTAIANLILPEILIAYHPPYMVSGVKFHLIPCRFGNLVFDSIVGGCYGIVIPIFNFSVRYRIICFPCGIIRLCFRFPRLCYRCHGFRYGFRYLRSCCLCLFCFFYFFRFLRICCFLFRCFCSRCFFNNLCCFYHRFSHRFCDCRRCFCDCLRFFFCFCCFRFCRFCRDALRHQIIIRQNRSGRKHKQHCQSDS